jgi:hypothetical protein
VLPAVVASLRDNKGRVLPERLPEWVRRHIGLLPGVRILLLSRHGSRLLPGIDTGVLWRNGLR